MNTGISIVKVGGKLLENPESLDSFCQAFAALEGKKVLVHGGGERASELSRRLGHTPRMLGGRRITDTHALEVAMMVYAGWANKTLVARLHALGCKSLGLSGADAGCIRSKKRPVGEVDFGWVGDVEEVNGEQLLAFLEQGLVPVLCALTHDGKGQMLNTNADTIACEVAIALAPFASCQLMYCFDRAGVLRSLEDEKSLIPVLGHTAYRQMQEEGQIASGMLPKLHNGFRALQNNVSRVCVGAPDMLLPHHATFTELEL